MAAPRLDEEVDDDPGDRATPLSGTQLSELAGSDDIVAVDMAGDGVYVLTSEGEPVARLQLEQGLEATGLVVCDGRVSFTPVDPGSGEGEQQIVFDTESREVTSIDAPGSIGLNFCSDEALTWTQLSGKGRTWVQVAW